MGLEIWRVAPSDAIINKHQPQIHDSITPPSLLLLFHIRQSIPRTLQRFSSLEEKGFHHGRIQVCLPHARPWFTCSGTNILGVPTLTTLHLQARISRVVKQPPPTQRHESRAMRYRVCGVKGVFWSCGGSDRGTAFVHGGQTMVLGSSWLIHTNSAALCQVFDSIFCK